MKTQILFIQGAGEGAYEEDAKLVEDLRRSLGPGYDITYPAMPNEADVSYEEWRHFIEEILTEIKAPVIIIGHSVGGSVILKYLSEAQAQESLVGICLMAAPFWGGDGWLYDGYQKLELPVDLAAKLPSETPISLYHCKDDDTVPSEHLGLYKALLPHATTHLIDRGGHQFSHGVDGIAQKLKTLTGSK